MKTVKVDRINASKRMIKVAELYHDCRFPLSSGLQDSLLKLQEKNPDKENLVSIVLSRKIEIPRTMLKVLSVLAIEKNMPVLIRNSLNATKTHTSSIISLKSVDKAKARALLELMKENQPSKELAELLHGRSKIEYLSNLNIISYTWKEIINFLEKVLEAKILEDKPK